MNAVGHCDICGGEGGEVRRLTCRSAEGRKVAYAICPSCGVMRMDPLPGPEEVTRFYSAVSYGVGASKFPGWLERHRDGTQARRAAWVQSSLNPDCGKALDIGCGNGVFLQCLAQRGWRIYGTELPGPAAVRAGTVSGMNLRTGELDEDSYEEGFFDAVTMWHVLEHLRDPLGVLRRCRRSLGRSGQLFLEVPNLGSWQARVFGRHWLHLDPPRHLTQFTGQALDDLLGRAGFEVMERETYSLSMGLLGVIQSALNAVMGSRDLLYHLLLTRGRWRASFYSKAGTVLGGMLLAPLALLWVLGEGCAGAGAVLRYRCRVADSTIPAGSHENQR